MRLRPRLPSDLIRGMNLVGDRLRAPQVRKVLADTAKIPNIVPFAAYFAGAPTDLYQIEQWFQPLLQLDSSAGGVVLLVTNPRSAMAIGRATSLPVVFSPTSDSVESFVRRHAVKALMYFNNNQANFTTLRINGPAHVHLSHGESEKSSMTSNQLKAYDYAFIAGQASADRILQNVKRFDAKHLIEIGRPQFDSVQPTSFPDLAGRTRVLYAPTWEGDGHDMAYGSLDTSGEEIVEELLSDERIQLIFRPHPKTGALSASYARSLARVKHRLGVANAKGSALHVVDTTAIAMATIKACDVIISDTSAMSMDAVGLDVPLVLTVGSRPETEMATTPDHAHAGLRDVIPTLDGMPVSALPTWLISQAAAGVSPQQRQFREYVFGSAYAASGTERFIVAMQSVTADTSPER